MAALTALTVNGKAEFLAFILGCGMTSLQLWPLVILELHKK